MSSRSGPAAALPAQLAGTPLAAAEVLRPLGEGRRSGVYLIRWQGLECVLKIYTEEAVRKHRGRHPVPMARYEFARNRMLFRTPGIAGFVARPIGFVDRGPLQAFVQEHVPGELFEHFRRRATEPQLQQAVTSLRELVARAHAAGIFDMDLHPNNVMVVGDPVHGHRIKLFDFNNIPVHERHSHLLKQALFALRVIRPQSRDLRRLHLFTDPPGVNRFGTRRQR